MRRILVINNYTKIIIVLFIVVLIGMTFNNKYDSLISDFEDEAKAKEAKISRHIDLSNSFIHSLAIYGNNYFKQKEHADSELYNNLTYDSNSDTYNLDAVAGTEYQNSVGNLTGKGPIPRSGHYREEINLALEYNQYFNSSYKLMPDVAWLYYTSENNFINIYPWISSKEFIYTDELKKTEYYTYVTPQKNPLRKPLWTPVYLDQAGKGLMVSLSSPVYGNNTFMGVVSLDLTNKMISEMIASEYEIYLIDFLDSVIATSTDIKFDKEVIKFNMLLNASQDDINRLKALERNRIVRWGGYYIYSCDFINAPWKMYLLVPLWTIIYQSILFTLPILLICLFLMFTIFEIEKRKTAEAQLTNSLKELQSYHELLENAAKFDFLTSTYNRRGFKEAFDKTLAANTINETPISFIMGDIDHFKELNDTYGHAAGDKVLIEIANLMKDNKSDGDLVCRWGGEEFLIMLYNKTYDQAKMFAESVRQQVEAAVIPHNSNVLQVTMTFGVTEYNYYESYETSISEADSALYIGKFKGRNQVVAYQNLMSHQQVLGYEWS